MLHKECQHKIFSVSVIVVVLLTSQTIVAATFDRSSIVTSGYVENENLRSDSQNSESLAIPPISNPNENTRIFFSTENEKRSQDHLNRISITLNPGESHNAQIQTFISQDSVNKGDIMFVFDCTASMQEEINQTKASALQIMSDIRSRLPYAWFGIGSFMDYPSHYEYPGYSDTYGVASDGDVPWFLPLALTGNITDVSTSLQYLLRMGNGEDTPEAYTRALYEVSQPEIGWRSGAKKVVVLFGDAPTHDLDFAGYNFGGDPGRDAIAQTSDDLDFETIVQQVADKGISIVAVNSEYTPESEATFKGMSIGYATASGTNGQYFHLSEVSQIPTAVVQLIISETQQIDHLSLQVTKEYEGWVQSTPSEYTHVGSNITKTFNITITAPNGTPAGFYPFLIQTIGDDAILELTYVDVTVPSDKPTADLGFRPDHDGFGFKNDSSTRPWEMFRYFFGAQQVEYPNGSRIHAADEFYRRYYRDAGAGGSCDGFSATSLINYKGLTQPNAGPYKIPHRSPLYSEDMNYHNEKAIAFAQGIPAGLEIGGHVQHMCAALGNSPTMFYRYLKSHIQNNSPATLWISWKKDGKVKIHSLVPYRYEEPSGDKAYVYVYDSNHPGDNGRRVEFDLTNNKWKYIIEDRWLFPQIVEGDDSWCNLAVIPIDMYRHQGVAYWKQDGWTIASNKATSTATAQIFATSGAGRLLFTDDEGRRLGWDNVDFYDEIPDAIYIPVAEGNTIEQTGFYYIPSTMRYDLKMYGYSTGQVNVSAFGDGYLVQLSSLEVVTGSIVSLDVAAGGSGISVNSASNDTQGSLSVSQMLSDEDRTVTVKDLTIGSGEEIKLQFIVSDTVGFTDTIRLGTTSAVSRTYSLVMQRAGGEGYSPFGHANLVLNAGSNSLVNVSNWSDLSTITVSVDLDKDETIDEIRPISDEGIISTVSLEPAWDVAYTGGEQVSIIVAVRDQFGSYIDDGQPVSFTTSLGALSNENGVTKGGLVYLTLTTSNVEGNALVTAQSGGRVGTTSITIINHKHFVYLPLVSINQYPTNTSVFYGDTGDGEVLNRWCSEDWNTCRNASMGNARWEGLTVGTVGAGFDSMGYTIQRIFFFFDTSSIPTNAQITSAILDIYVGQYLNGNNAFHVVRSTASMPLSSTHFGEIDFDSGGTTTANSPNAWVSINLSSTALGWIATDEMTKIALIHDYDLSNTPPNAYNDVLLALAENSQYCPRLVVTYSLP